MKRAKYTGPLAHLVGKTALIKEATHGYVVAQFDDRSLTKSGGPMPKIKPLGYEPHARFPTEQEEDYPEPPSDALGFGWHAFHKSHFEIMGDSD